MMPSSSQEFDHQLILDNIWRWQFHHRQKGEERREEERRGGQKKQQLLAKTNRAARA